nr:unnamed protein product [Callosobruchus analis]
MEMQRKPKPSIKTAFDSSYVAPSSLSISMSMAMKYQGVCIMDDPSYSSMSVMFSPSQFALGLVSYPPFGLLFYIVGMRIVDGIPVFVVRWSLEMERIVLE